MNARIFLKEVRFNLTVVSGEHLKMKSMTFVSFHRIYFLFILSGSWNLSWRTWCSRILGLENLGISVSTFPMVTLYYVAKRPPSSSIS